MGLGEERLLDESRCEHVAMARERAWLPRMRDGSIVNGTLAPHPFCACCGTVAVLGSDIGLPLGFYINVLSDIAREYDHGPSRAIPLTRAQRGLIVRGLSDIPCFMDPFGVSRSAQIELFVAAVRQVRPDIPRAAILESIQPCRA